MLPAEFRRPRTAHENQAPRVRRQEILTRIYYRDWIVLDLPPSLNNLFPGVGQRHISKEYAAWKKDNLDTMRQLRPPAKLPAKIQVTILETMTGDLDNRLKAILDLAVEAGVIPGDSVKYIVGVNIDYAPTFDGIGARVEFLAS